MGRQRTDEEVGQRLGELLTRQEDLQEQLAALTSHLRAEADALSGPLDNPPVRQVDLDHVLELLGRLAVAPTAADAVEVIVSAARHLLPGTRGALCQGDGQQEAMATLGVWDAEEQWNRSYQGGTRETPPQRLAGRVSAGPTGQASLYTVRGFGLRIGELRVWPEDGLEHLDSDVLDGRAELLARCAGLVLGGMELQHRLRHNTVRDPMTGLFNRRYLLDTLGRELHVAGRRQSSLALLMVDIDQFSRFNDRYGHAAGNHMLEALGTLMLSRFRASDICCRYSGERFAIMLPDTDLGDARRRGDELVGAIAELRPRYGDHPLDAVRVSAGAAAFPEHAENRDDLIAASESAVTLSRQAGGNTLSCAERQ